MLLRFIALSVLAVPLCVGCTAGGVSGTLDDEGVPSFSSSALVTAEIEDFPDIDQVVARFTSFGGLCELWAADLDILNRDDSRSDKARDREDLYKERAPQDWWTAEVNVVIDDEDDLNGADLEPGRFDDDSILSVTVCHHEDWPEADGEDLDFDADCYRADDGELVFRYDGENEARTIHIDGDLEMEDLDGDNAGDIRFGGSASSCDPADDEFEESVR